MEKTKRMSYILLTFMLITICLLFIYGFYFDIWGKRFADMPQLVVYGFYTIFLVMAIEVVIAVRIGAKYEKLYGKQELSSKTILILFIIGLVLLAIIQLCYLPWKVDIKDSKTISETLSLGEHPLWNPPHILNIKGVKIKVHSIIDFNKVIINNIFTFLFLLVVGISAYFKALKREKNMNSKEP